MKVQHYGVDCSANTKKSKIKQYKFNFECYHTTSILPCNKAIYNWKIDVKVKNKIREPWQINALDKDFKESYNNFHRKPLF